MSISWLDEKEDELLAGSGDLGKRGLGVVGNFINYMWHETPIKHAPPLVVARGVAAAGKGALGTEAGRAALSFMGTLWNASTEYGVKRPFGYLAQRNIDPIAFLPIPVAMRPDDPDRVSLIRTALNLPSATPTTAFTPNAMRLLGLALTGDPGRGVAGTGMVSGRLSDRVGEQRFEEIKRAPSTSEAFELAYEGHPILRFTHEMTFDPLNLLSLGAAGAARSGVVGTSRVARAVLVADNFANKIQGAPIHGALYGGKKALGATGLLDDAPRGILAKNLHNLNRALEQEQRIGLSPDDFAPPTAPSAPTPPPTTPAQAIKNIKEALKGTTTPQQTPSGGVKGVQEVAEEAAEEVAGTTPTPGTFTFRELTPEDVEHLPEPIRSILRPAPLEPERLMSDVEKNIRHIEYKVTNATKDVDRLPEGSYFRSYEEMQESIAAYRAAGRDPASDPRWDYVYPSIQRRLKIDTGRPNRLAEMSRPYREVVTWNDHLADLQEQGLVSQPKPVVPIDQLGAPPPDDALGIVHPAFRNRGFFGQQQQQAPGPRIADPDNPFDPRAQAAYQQAMAFPNVQRSLREMERGHDALEQVSAALAQADPSALKNVTTSDEFLALVDQHLPDLRNDVETLLQRWGLPGSDEAHRIRNARILIEAREGWAKELGIEHASNLLSREYGWLLSALRSINLLTPRQPAQNFIDELVKGTFEGIPHDVLARQFAARIQRVNGPVEEVLARAGVTEVPADWSGDLLRTIPRDTVQGVTEEFLRQSPFRRFQDTPLAKYPARALSFADEVRRDLDVGAQMVFREVSGLTGFQRSLSEQMPGFIAEAEKLAGQRGKALGDALRQLDFLVSPDDIKDVVIRATGDQALADRLRLRWHRVINEAINDGTTLANRVHFDYTDIRKIDEWIKPFTLFHFWASRNIPYYAATFAKNPWILRALLKYQDIGEDEREAFGLPHRMLGKVVRVPLPATLALGLFGDQMTLAFDPAVSLSIYDQLRERGQEDEYTPVMGRVLHAMGRTGLSPAPWFNDFLNALGAYGADEPNSWLRHGGLIYALTGVDLGAWRRNIIADARETFTGAAADIPKVSEFLGIHEIPSERSLSGSLIRDFQINKKIREMAYTETGNPRDPRYTAAMGDPKNPIYQEAQRRVRNEQIIREFYGMVSPFPLSFMSGTEEMARQAGAPLRDLPLSQATISALYESNDPATLYGGMPQGARETQIRTAQALIEHFGRLQLKNPNFVSALASLYPEWAKYRAWQAGQPPGANVSVDAYLGNLIDKRDAQRILTELYGAGVTPEQIQGYLIQQGKASILDLTLHQAQQMKRHLTDH